MLVAVKHRQEVYGNLDRFAYQINPVTGGIEFVDLVPDGRQHHRTGRPTRGRAGAGARPKPLFAAYTDGQLLELGVAEPLLPQIREITTEDELLGLARLRAPAHRRRAASRSTTARPYDEVLDAGHRAGTRPTNRSTPTTTRRRWNARPRRSPPTTTRCRRCWVRRSSAGRCSCTPPSASSSSGVQRARPGSAADPAPARPSSRCTGSSTWSEQLRPGTDKPSCSPPSTGTSPPTCVSGCWRSVARSWWSAGRHRQHRQLASADRRRGRSPAAVAGGSTTPGRRPSGRRLLVERGEHRWDAEFLAAEWTQVILGQVRHLPHRLLQGPPRRAWTQPHPGRTGPDLAADRTLHQLAGRAKGCGPGGRSPNAPPAWRWTGRRPTDRQPFSADVLGGFWTGPATGTSSSTRRRTSAPRTGRCCAPWSRPAPTTCSWPATPISASTTTTSPWAASASTSGAARPD